MLLVSVHTPKAGGTSIGKALYREFRHEFLWENSLNPADPLSIVNMGGSYRIDEAALLAAGVSCVHGHFAPRMLKGGASALLFTMLRHPVENIVSIYFYWRAMQGASDRLHGRLLGADVDVLSFARWPLLTRLYSETYFGGFDMRRFDLIGIHDRREEAMVRLGQLVGRRFHGGILENVTPSSPRRQEMLADQRTMSRLADILVDDVRFFDRYAAG